MGFHLILLEYLEVFLDWSHGAIKACRGGRQGSWQRCKICYLRWSILAPRWVKACPKHCLLE